MHNKQFKGIITKAISDFVKENRYGIQVRALEKESILSYIRSLIYIDNGDGMDVSDDYFMLDDYEDDFKECAREVLSGFRIYFVVLNGEYADAFMDDEEEATKEARRLKSELDPEADRLGWKKPDIRVKVATIWEIETTQDWKYREIEY